MKSSTRGFTMLEVAISLGIAGLLFAALVTFFVRGISSNRFQFEHLLTTDQGRFLFDRITQEIRLAQSGPNGEPWLAGATDYYLYFYANVDNDPDIERVGYAMWGTQLRRAVLQPGETEETVTVFDNVRNNGSQPLFTYYGDGEAQLNPDEVNSESVRTVKVSIVIDVNPNQEPGPLELSTFVTPRLLHNVSGVAARLNAVSLNYPPDDQTSLNMEVRITYPNTGTTGLEVWPIVSVNDRLTTYSGEKVNINYQTVTVGSHLPGWYAWVGPIVVGESGGQQYTVTEQLQISDICLGSDFQQLLLTCPKRTVTYGPFSKEYQPVVLYERNGYQDYVSSITFTYNPNGGEESPAPSPGPSLSTLAYWKFDDTGSNPTDSSGNNHVSSLNNGLPSGYTSSDKPTLGFSNTSSLHFDGRDDDMSITNAADLSVTSNFTFSTWIKDSSSLFQMLYVAGSPNSPYSGFRIWLDTNGKVNMRTGTSTSVFSSAAVNDDQWHHVAVVVQSSGQVDFYIDGSSSGSYSLDNNFVFPITAYSGTRYLGENPSASTQNFSGYLDDVRLYAVALNSTQIQQLANGENP